MWCIQCGRRIDDDSRFCEYCGARVEHIPTYAPSPSYPTQPGSAGSSMSAFFVPADDLPAHQPVYAPMGSFVNEFGFEQTTPPVMPVMPGMDPYASPVIAPGGRSLEQEAYDPYSPGFPQPEPVNYGAPIYAASSFMEEPTIPSYPPRPGAVVMPAAPMTGYPTTERSESIPVCTPAVENVEYPAMPFAPPSAPEFVPVIPEYPEPVQPSAPVMPMPFPVPEPMPEDVQPAAPETVPVEAPDLPEPAVPVPEPEQGAAPVMSMPFPVPPASEPVSAISEPEPEAVPAISETAPETAQISRMDEIDSSEAETVVVKDENDVYGKESFDLRDEPATPAAVPSWVPVASSAAAAAARPVRQLNCGRKLWKMVLLTFVTFGIYGLVHYCKMSSEINLTASKHDGRHTMHYIAVFFLASVTLGIVPLVWSHKFSTRVGNEARRRGCTTSFGAGTFWLWNILGSVIVVGTFVYLHKLLGVMNYINKDYNEHG